MIACINCGAEFAEARKALGYNTCLECGAEEAKKIVRTIAPMHKSNYMLISNLDDLKGINNKGGLIR